jgi:hypothetical protein
MKLEIKHLAPYLPYELKYKFNNTIYYYQHCSTREFDYENSKPILRPLSDLTNEIEVNGEKFVPINNIHLADEEGYFGCGSLDDIQQLIISQPIKKIPYCFVEKLLEWHFDVFGLIENNLAIDINTLKQ